MAIEIEVIERKKVAVKYLQVEAGVRYFDDASVNGEDDSETNPRMPFVVNGAWRPLIDIERGQVVGWPEGVTADIHYKVCDAGVYRLLDENRSEVTMYDGYVPSMLCPNENGYGDYIIMSIDGAGLIANWQADLSDFTPEE